MYNMEGVCAPMVAHPTSEPSHFPEQASFGELALDTPATLINRTVSTLRRVVIESVEPEVDSGKFPIKRCVGDRVRVQADIFADGHDQLGARLLFRYAGDSEWPEATLLPIP